MTRFREHFFGLNSGSGHKQYRRSGFDDLLYDAVYLAQLAHDQASRELDDNYTGDCISATLARASSISSMLTVECAANCCVDVMP